MRQHICTGGILINTKVGVIWLRDGGNLGLCSFAVADRWVEDERVKFDGEEKIGTRHCGGFVLVL